MLALLAIVALASRGRSPDSGGADGRAPTAVFWDYLYTGTIVLMVLGTVVLVITLWWGREGLVAERGKRGNQALAGIVVFGLVIGLLLLARELRGKGFNLPTPPQPTATGVVDPRLQPVDARRADPEFQWLPVAVLGIAAAGTVGFFVVRDRRSRRRRGPDDEAFAQELAGVVDDALDDLRAEPDPRKAVIAAYARMERTLAARGTPRAEAEAPLEYLDRASRGLRGRYPAARRLLFELTHLFERAKFSAQTVDAAMKDDAIETLVRLRDELREERA